MSSLENMSSLDFMTIVIVGIVISLLIKWSFFIIKWRLRRKKNSKNAPTWEQIEQRLAESSANAELEKAATEKSVAVQLHQLQAQFDAAQNLHESRMADMQTNCKKQLADQAYVHQCELEKEILRCETEMNKVQVKLDAAEAEAAKWQKKFAELTHWVQTRQNTEEFFLGEVPQVHSPTPTPQKPKPKPNGKTHQPTDF